MQTNHEKALKKLKEMEAKALQLEGQAQVLENQAQQLEAQAAGFRKECHITRCLLEGDVSTSTEESVNVNQAVVANVVAKRQSFLNKKTRQVASVGHL
jgi:hypothetical protein